MKTYPSRRPLLLLPRVVRDEVLGHIAFFLFIVIVIRVHNQAEKHLCCLC